MAYHIKKPSLLNPSVSLYYAGGVRWTDDYGDRKVYAEESEANTRIAPGDGRNGGFNGASVVNEG